MLTTTMNPVTALDDPERLLAASEAARAQGEPVRAGELARRAAVAARAGGERRLAARADALLGLSLWRQGLPEAALDVASRALADTDALGTPAWAIELRHTIVMASCELLIPADALPHAVAALRLAREHEGVLGAGPVSWSLNRLSTVYESLGDVDRAIELMQEAARVARAGGDLEVRFAAQVNLASAFNAAAQQADDAGEPDPRRTHASQALQAARLALSLAGGHPHREMMCFGIECTALEWAGDSAAMFPAIERHQALARRMQLPHFLALGEMLRVRALLACGRAEAACEALDAVLAGNPFEGDEEAISRALEVGWRVYRAAGRTAESLRALESLRQRERCQMQRRIAAASRSLLRELEVESARHEAAALRRRAAELEQRAAEATHAALQDSLTGLANRRALDSSLLSWLREEGRQAVGDSRFCAALIDIDHFKAINDTHGHDVGDQVLRELAQLLTAGTRDGDFVARSGGEEFVLLLAGSALERAAEVCERLRLRVQQHDWSRVLPPAAAGRGAAITISIGLTAATALDDVSSLRRRADMAMYRAKHAGRNRLEIDTAARA
jgi:two-component system, cell cycle response regulator